MKVLQVRLLLAPMELIQFNKNMKRISLLFLICFLVSCKNDETISLSSTSQSNKDTSISISSYTSKSEISDISVEEDDGSWGDIKF